VLIYRFWSNRCPQVSCKIFSCQEKLTKTNLSIQTQESNNKREQQVYKHFSLASALTTALPPSFLTSAGARAIFESTSLASGVPNNSTEPTIDNAPHNQSSSFFIWTGITLVPTATAFLGACIARLRWERCRAEELFLEKMVRMHD